MRNMNSMCGKREITRNRILVLAVAILLVSMLMPVWASMALTVDDGGNDGYVKGCNCGLPLGEGTYEEAHNTAFSYVQSPLDLYVGQMYANKEYFVWRSYLSFNTSNIPTGGIATVTLRLYGEPLGGDLSDTDFTIHVRKWISNNTRPFNEDYYAYSSDDLGTFNTTNYNADGDNNITLTPSTVSAGAMTNLCLVSSRDLSVVTPTGNEYVMFMTAIKPVLIVTYTEQIGFTGPQFLAVAVFVSVIVALVYRRSKHKRADLKNCSMNTSVFFSNPSFGLENDNRA
jgi:hypothetical protein